MITKDNAAFSRLFWLAVTILALAVAGLSAANLLHGPRLRYATVDTRLTTSLPNQRLQLQANQALANVKPTQVSIRPAASFNVTTSANTVSIIFKQRLDYGQHYTVTISDVASRYNDHRTSTLSYSFATFLPKVYYLQRAGTYDRTAAQPDRIVESDITGASPRPVYSNRRIQEFAVLRDRLVVVALNDDGSSALHYVDPRSGQASLAALPGSGRISQLQASNNGSLYGYRFNDLSASAGGDQNKLYIQDVSPGHVLTGLLGFGATPPSVLEWLFAPDGTSVVLRDFGNNTWLADSSSGRPPVALGQFSGLGDFAADGKQLTVRGRDGFALLDIPARRSAKLQSELVRVNDRPAVPIQVLPLPNQSGEIVYAQASSSDNSNNVTEALISHTPQGQTVIYSGQTNQRLSFGFSLSSNGQYVVIEQSDHQPSDNYPSARSRPLDSYSRLLDRQGQLIAELPGQNLAWQLP